MAATTQRLLMASMMGSCSEAECQSIEDVLTSSGRTDISVHKWCVLTGEPPEPAAGELFDFAYVMAHGDLAGCSFCTAAQLCGSKISIMERICDHLKDGALVVAACCWCGSGDSARQIACGCAQPIDEIVGPPAAINDGDMRKRAADFFKAIAGGVTHVEAASRANLQHNFVVDLDLDECEP